MIDRILILSASSLGFVIRVLKRYNLYLSTHKYSTDCKSALANKKTEKRALKGQYILTQNKVRYERHPG